MAPRVTDVPQRKQVVKRQGKIACGDAKAGEDDRAGFGFPQCSIKIVNIEILEHIIEDIAGSSDDRDTERNAELMKKLLLAHIRDRSAQCFQHPDLELDMTSTHA